MLPAWEGENNHSKILPEVSILLKETCPLRKLFYHRPSNVCFYQKSGRERKYPTLGPFSLWRGVKYHTSPPPLLAFNVRSGKLPTPGCKFSPLGGKSGRSREELVKVVAQRHRIRMEIWKITNCIISIQWTIYSATKKWAIDLWRYMKES